MCVGGWYLANCEQITNEWLSLLLILYIPFPSLPMPSQFTSYPLLWFSPYIISNPSHRFVPQFPTLLFTLTAPLLYITHFFFLNFYHPCLGFKRWILIHGFVFNVSCNGFACMDHSFSFSFFSSSSLRIIPFFVLLSPTMPVVMYTHIILCFNSIPFTQRGNIYSSLISPLSFGKGGSEDFIYLFIF